MIARRVLIGCGAVLGVVALTGCQDAPPVPPVPLGVTCATLPCACFAEDQPFWLRPKTADIQWQENGNAACPAGYELRRTGKKP